MSLSVSQYVVKVCGRCDLACDHCYVYEHADQSWRIKPKSIDAETLGQAAWRIRQHAEAHQLDRVHVVLHGGEPLLLGRDGLHEVISALRSTIDPVTRLDLRIHTNGVQLDEALCALFVDYGVRVGLSLDGDQVANDRHRRFANGQSSYEHVRRALALLRRPEYRHLYAGILCTVDVANDPVTVYEALLAEAPPRLDLLLPHATWDRPPPRPSGEATPYAAWLGRIHSRWLADGRPVPIRFFDSLLAAWLGRPSESEAVGVDPVDLLVIETDGSWEQTDSLKVAFDNAPATGLNVFSHSVDQAAAYPGVAARQTGIAGLCPACRACPVVRACGGGLYSHRYKSGNDFDNPSVYCEDLKALIPQVTTSPAAAAAPVRPGSPATGHVLPGEILDLLAAGPGDPAAMAFLADSQWSVTRALVATIAAGLNGRASDLQRAAADGWTLLCALDGEQPEAVRKTLTYPYVQAWAMRCLRPAASGDFDLDCAHLACLAAAAAWQAGTESELVMPVREGSIYLPGVGALALGGGVGRTSVARISATGLSAGDGIGDWRPVREVAAGGWSVTVEDLDPFRDCQAWVPADRLSAPAWQAWQAGLAAAARRLTAELADYSRVVGAGLRSVVPMRSGTAGHHQSGTARQAFGAMALALPDDAGTLSELIVHEMQHVKLAAVCDLLDLFDPADTSLFAVPWRADRRPVEGLLQGTYAYLAVTELWRSRASRALDAEARQLFLTYRTWVERGIDSLLDAVALTAEGKRFVNGMAATVAAWPDDV